MSDPDLLEMARKAIGADNGAVRKVRFYVIKPPGPLNMQAYREIAREIGNHHTEVEVVTEPGSWP